MCRCPRGVPTGPLRSRPRYGSVRALVDTAPGERWGGAMPTTRLDTDYLVLGAGAMSLAFVDVILAEDPTAQLVMVDRRDSPGGHWNDACPFVRLHQPAAFYGLNSKHLGEGGVDLASGPEVVAYYKRALSHFLATDRVQFLPMCEFQGDGRVVS